MTSKLFGAALALLALAGAARAQAPASKCSINQVGEFKVRVERLQPLTTVRINGRPAPALIDTGAATTVLSVDGASALGLPLQNLNNVMVSGAGGATQAYRVTIADFEVAGARLKNFGAIVAGRGIGVPMLIGRDFLGRADLELDLRNGVVRLLEPKGCASEQMPYWAAKGYSEAPLRRAGPLSAMEVEVRLNGKPVRAILDSGAQVSVATPAAASRAGVKLERMEIQAGGVGPRKLDQFVGQLDGFALGDEQIGRTRLRVADLFRGSGSVSTGSRIASDSMSHPEMLLGADFLRSHRVLVSPSQRKIYFTYEGGPVFDVSKEALEAAAKPAEAAGPPPPTSR